MGAFVYTPPPPSAPSSLSTVKRLHVNITYWNAKDNMYYFLKSPFFLYLKYPTGVHTSYYINNIQWITVNGVKLSEQIRFVPDVWRICYALTPNFFVSVDGRFLQQNASLRICWEEVCDKDIFFGRDPIKDWLIFVLYSPISMYMITIIICWKIAVN